MILITCVDDNFGMVFNHRRQSQDRVLKKRILQMTGKSVLWMNQYTAEQFKGVHAPQIRVDDSFLKKAGPGEYCFAETDSVEPYEKKCEKIILFKWNRRYPRDLYFDIPLKTHGWKRIASASFPGSSHEKIDVEVYKK